MAAERQRQCADDHDEELQHAPIVAGVGAKINGTSFGEPHVTELRGGVEYLAIPGPNQLFLRASASVANYGAETFGLLDVPNKGVTVGGGVTAGPHVQVDAAFVAASSRFIASAGVRF